MKIGLALRELHRSETSLARQLSELSDRHRAEPEIHHIARDLAAWSRDHVRALAEAGRSWGLDLSPDAPERPGSPAPVRIASDDLLADRPEPGLELLADLRGLHRACAGVSLDWELLAQSAQAAKKAGLVELAGRCHPQTLRQLKWSNAMLKELSPQILTS
ncbi:hypothetical protein GCM10027445_19300 [Amycolatopsis endophytica]|uniref:Uncharacterized protein n=1 Tax=Amycolatopsis endophytica TaxID=860233 RepID=A0A853BD77_9PSEU|nr:hypothetical protein [Amycolatopsis endophytica]NYI93179.1 hypothetical protein [Amycolatopsis endophytica]